MTVDYTRPPVVPPPPPLQPPQPQKSSGCWIWGCIGCSAIAILCAAAIAVVVGVAFGAMKRSDMYRGAWKSAQHDPRVIAALGSPVEDGWWMTGHINVDDNRGTADIEFPIHGPKGSATVHAVGTKVEGVWRYSELTVTPSNGPPIDLLKP